MPFVPLTPEEQSKFKPPCQSREHNPPNMMVIDHVMKWVCPECGAAVIVQPNRVTLADLRADLRPAVDIPLDANDCRW